MPTSVETPTPTPIRHDPVLGRVAFAEALRGATEPGDLVEIHPTFPCRMDLAFHLDRDGRVLYSLAALRTPVTGQAVYYGSYGASPGPHPHAARAHVVVALMPRYLSADERRLLLAGIVALALAMGVGRFLYTPMLPLMLRGHALDAAGGGWLATVNFVGYLAGALYAALGVPAARRTAAVATALAATVATTAGMGLSDSYAVWAVLRFIADGPRFLAVNFTPQLQWRLADDAVLFCGHLLLRLQRADAPVQEASSWVTALWRREGGESWRLAVFQSTKSAEP